MYTPTIHHAVLASNYSPVYFFQFSYEGKMGNSRSGFTGEYKRCLYKGMSVKFMNLLSFLNLPLR